MSHHHEHRYFQNSLHIHILHTIPNYNYFIIYQQIIEVYIPSKYMYIFIIEEHYRNHVHTVKVSKLMFNTRYHFSVLLAKKKASGEII